MVKWEKVKFDTWKDTEIMFSIIDRVFLTTKESIIDFKIKGDKVKIIASRYPVEYAFKDRKVFQQIVDLNYFKKEIRKYISEKLKTFLKAN